MRKHHSAAGGAALALVLALMGCSDGTGSSAEDTSGATPTKTPTSASPTPTPTTPEERATGQLVKYLKARDDALQSLRFVGKRFEGVAAGQEFLTLQQRIIEYSSNKFTLSGEYVHTLSEPRQRSDSTMLVEVCEDESSVDFVTEAGTPVTRSLGGAPIPIARSLKYTLTLKKGRWLVTASTYVLDEDGHVLPC